MHRNGTVVGHWYRHKYKYLYPMQWLENQEKKWPNFEQIIDWHLHSFVKFSLTNWLAS